MESEAFWGTWKKIHYNWRWEIQHPSKVYFSFCRALDCGTNLQSQNSKKWLVPNSLGNLKFSAKRLDHRGTEEVWAGPQSCQFIKMVKEGWSLGSTILEKLYMWTTNLVDVKSVFQEEGLQIEPEACSWQPKATEVKALPCSDWCVAKQCYAPKKALLWSLWQTS